MVGSLTFCLVRTCRSIVDHPRFWKLFLDPFVSNKSQPTQPTQMVFLPDFLTSRQYETFFPLQPVGLPFLCYTWIFRCDIKSILDVMILPHILEALCTRHPFQVALHYGGLELRPTLCFDPLLPWPSYPSASVSSVDLCNAFIVRLMLWHHIEARHRERF